MALSSRAGLNLICQSKDIVDQLGFNQNIYQRIALARCLYHLFDQQQGIVDGGAATLSDLGAGNMYPAVCLILLDDDDEVWFFDVTDAQIINFDNVATANADLYAVIEIDPTHVPNAAKGNISSVKFFAYDTIDVAPTDAMKIGTGTVAAGLFTSFSTPPHLFVQIPVAFSAGFQDFTLPHDNGNGTLTLVDHNVYLYDNTTFIGKPKRYVLTGGTTGIEFDAIPNAQTSYIVANYNSGSPIFDVITNVELITESNILPYVTVYRNGNYLFMLGWDQMGLGLSNKLHQRFVKTARFARESGLVLTESAGNVVKISAGVAWNGAHRYQIEEFDSSTDLLCFFYHVGGI